MSKENKKLIAEMANEQEAPASTGILLQAGLDRTVNAIDKVADRSDNNESDIFELQAGHFDVNGDGSKITQIFDANGDLISSGGGNINIIKPTGQEEKIYFPDALMESIGDSRKFTFNLSATAKNPATLDVIAEDNGADNLDYSQKVQFSITNLVPGVEQTGSTHETYKYKVNLSVDLKTLTIEYNFQYDTLYATKNLFMKILSDRISPDDVYNSELVDNKLLEIKREAVLGNERLLSETSTGSIAATGAKITNQGNWSVAVGFAAGSVYQGESSVAIGSGAGQINQGKKSIAIGWNASNSTQPDNSIAIGPETKPLKEGDILIQTSGTSNSNDNKLEVKDGKLYVNDKEIAFV